jgi:hypothetical protein
VQNTSKAINIYENMWTSNKNFKDATISSIGTRIAILLDFTTRGPGCIILTLMELLDSFKPKVQLITGRELNHDYYGVREHGLKSCMHIAQFGGTFAVRNSSKCSNSFFDDSFLLPLSSSIPFFGL